MSELVSQQFFLSILEIQRRMLQKMSAGIYGEDDGEDAFDDGRELGLNDLDEEDSEEHIPKRFKPNEDSKSKNCKPVRRRASGLISELVENQKSSQSQAELLAITMMRESREEKKIQQQMQMQMQQQMQMQNMMMMSMMAKMCGGAPSYNSSSAAMPFPGSYLGPMSTFTPTTSSHSSSSSDSCYVFDHDFTGGGVSND